MIDKNSFVFPSVEESPEGSQESKIYVIDDFLPGTSGIIPQNGPYSVDGDVFVFAGRLEQFVFISLKDFVFRITRDLRKDFDIVSAVLPLRSDIVYQKFFREESFCQNQDFHFR